MEIRLTKFGPDSIEYLVPSWDDMDKLIFEVAKNINESGQEFDRIVTLAKGGWPMTRSLVDYTKIDEVASIGLKFYSGIDKRMDKPVVYQDIPIEVEGERILLFDDVADTGESLEFVKEYLKSKKVASIKTATLFYKPRSVIKPDFYGQETSKWIIFPYELKETMEVLVPQWQEKGISKDQIIDRFVEMGFDREKVGYLYSVL